MIELHDAHVTEYGNHLIDHIEDGRWDQRVQDLVDQCRHALFAESAEATARKDVLLRAAYDLLVQCYKSEGQYMHSGERYKRYVPDPMATTVRYDDADCHGWCLLDDIAYELNLPDSSEL